jgi:hypothetical protein
MATTKRISVYILLTDDRVRAYTTHGRAIKVYKRAQRMGVKVEFMSCEARAGDPYKRAKVVDPWAAPDRCAACPAPEHPMDVPCVTP